LPGYWGRTGSHGGSSVSDKLIEKFGVNFVAGNRISLDGVLVRSDVGYPIPLLEDVRVIRYGGEPPFQDDV
jgi:hypothetical protein